MTTTARSCQHCARPMVGEGSICAECLDSGGATELAPPGGESTPPAAATAPIELGQPVSERYEVLETLGSGGMGVVYKARDTALGEVIALKVLANCYTQSAESIGVFKNEVRLARRVQHPHVARVYDLTRLDDRVAISMEFVEGRPLSDIVREQVPPVPLALDWFRSICSALEAAHRGGVVHRDLKPENVLIDQRDQPTLIDFGIAGTASVTDREDGELVGGTLAYMAPEQLRRDAPIDQRADVHAAGILLYRLLTGRLPFRARDLKALIEARRSAPPPMHELRPELSPALDAVVRRCFATDPAARPASADETWRLVEQAADQPSGPLPADSGAATAKRVLVVDDDPDLRAFAAAALGAQGLQVLEAENGYQAMEMALAEQPDLILLDVMMPVLDGREALRILKGNEQTRRIPVVVMTSLAGADEALGARALGADGFVNKPLQPEVMVMLVRKHAG